MVRKVFDVFLHKHPTSPPSSSNMEEDTQKNAVQFIVLILIFSSMSLMHTQYYNRQ